MRVIVLGCGGSAGVPMVGGHDEKGDWGACNPQEIKNKRSRSSIILEGESGNRLLVDTGPDLRYQLLRAGIARLDGVLYTHPHADHIAGLDDLRSVNRYMNKPLNIYGFETVMEELERRFSYAFRPWKPPGFFAPVVHKHLIEAWTTKTIADFSLQFFLQNHGRVDTLGFRCGNFAYSTDVVRLNKQALDILHGVDIWLVDCFQREEHPAHAHLGRVLEWHKQIKPRLTLLTHMGTDMDWDWLKQNLPPTIEPAYDGLVFNV
ncbi:MBL fold metallo-hydrolase [Entomobacter blattae]|uniref:Ribonuclease BN n=1 Tax=Entomobacter blattae TaxID=2762277 RepID=A0A7H1NT12_9PROT|nr:MBL fold metallo-hydrolase [Entomobacter blattae]QNT78922.1 Ribonuclease BN [Entomobacter blattae]